MDGLEPFPKPCVAGPIPARGAEKSLVGRGSDRPNRLAGSNRHSNGESDGYALSEQSALRRRSGLSPVAMSNVAAVSIPTPTRATRLGLGLPGNGRRLRITAGHHGRPTPTQLTAIPR